MGQFPDPAAALAAQQARARQPVADSYDATNRDLIGNRWNDFQRAAPVVAASAPFVGGFALDNPWTRGMYGADRVNVGVGALQDFTVNHPHWARTMGTGKLLGELAALPYMGALGGTAAWGGSMLGDQLLGNQPSMLGQ
jgi:hypothetical protein